MELAISGFKGAPLSEKEFVDFFMQSHADVEDEVFLAYLDFCDTASYGARSRRLRTLFWKLDTDGSGVVETFELKDYIRKLGAKFDTNVSEEEMNYSVAEFQ